MGADPILKDKDEDGAPVRCERCPGHPREDGTAALTSSARWSELCPETPGSGWAWAVAPARASLTGSAQGSLPARTKGKPSSCPHTGCFHSRCLWGLRPQPRVPIKGTPLKRDVQDVGRRPLATVH